MLLRKEYGVTDEEFFIRWDFWQAISYLDAARDICVRLNGGRPGHGHGGDRNQVVDLRSGPLSSQRLRDEGFSLRGG